MGNVQLVTPNQAATDATGMCLRFTQRVFQNRNPYYYNSAWDAWQAAAHKRTTPPPEDVAVPVYFAHYGTYGDPPTYANWGHVAVRFPGGGILSSPASGIGSEWYPNIAAIERAFNARYVGWAYDVGGLMVADVAPQKPAPDSNTPAAPAKKRKKNKMDYASVSYKMKNGRQHVKVFCLANGEEHNYEMTDLTYVKNVAATYQCGPHSIITESHFKAIAADLDATRKRLDARKG